MPNSLVRSITLTPALILISLPLAIFAVITTTLACSTLFFRVLIVSLVLLRNFALRSLLATRHASTTPSPLVSDDTKSAIANRTPEIENYMNDGVIYPHNLSSDRRDFEGLGGWSMEDSDDEDHVPWTVMNARLELPALIDERRPSNHRRSLTSGSLGSRIPIRIRSPARPGLPHARTCSSGGGVVHGTHHNGTGGEDYFTPKSTIALDAANIGRTLLRRKNSSASTIVLEISGRNLQ